MVVDGVLSVSGVLVLGIKLGSAWFIDIVTSNLVTFMASVAGLSKLKLNPQRKACSSFGRVRRSLSVTCVAVISNKTTEFD